MPTMPTIQNAPPIQLPFAQPQLIQQVVPAQPVVMPVQQLSFVSNVLGFFSHGANKLKNVYHQLHNIQDGTNIFTR